MAEVICQGSLCKGGGRHGKVPLTLIRLGKQRAVSDAQERRGSRSLYKRRGIWEQRRREGGRGQVQLYPTLRIDCYSASLALLTRYVSLVTLLVFNNPYIIPMSLCDQLL